MENLNLEKFNPTKAELLVLADEGRKLTINGIEDKAGYDMVHSLRMELKSARVKITKTGKEAREEALAFQKKVIAYEKELIAIIEPIELDLKAKQDAVDQAIEVEKRRAKIPERQAILTPLGIIGNDELLLMDDVEFQKYVNQKTADYLADQQAQIKADQEAKEAKIKAAQDKLKAEQDALAESKRIEEAKKQAEKEAQEKALRDAELAKIKAEEDKQAAVEAERKKAEVEKQRIIYEQKQKELERLQAEEKVRADAEVKAVKEKAEQEALEKKKKYQNFLEKHSYKDDDTFKIEKNGNKIILFKKVGEITI